MLTSARSTLRTSPAGPPHLRAPPTVCESLTDQSHGQCRISQKKGKSGKSGWKTDFGFLPIAFSVQILKSYQNIFSYQNITNEKADSAVMGPHIKSVSLVPVAAWLSASRRRNATTVALGTLRRVRMAPARLSGARPRGRPLGSSSALSSPHYSTRNMTETQPKKSQAFGS